MVAPLKSTGRGGIAIGKLIAKSTPSFPPESLPCLCSAKGVTMRFDLSPQVEENPFCDLTAEDWDEIFGPDG